MVVKFFLGIAIIAFTSFCGYVLAKKYRQRKLFLGQFYSFNERFINEISYYRRPIIEFALEYSYKGEFAYLLECFFKDVENASYVLELTLARNEFSFLKKEEKVFIKDYFLSLGRGDSASQKTHFSSLKQSLQNMQTEAETTCKRYGDLYIKIGFLFGLLILILIL